MGAKYRKQNFNSGGNGELRDSLDLFLCHLKVKYSKWAKLFNITCRSPAGSRRANLGRHIDSRRGVVIRATTQYHNHRVQANTFNLLLWWHYLYIWSYYMPLQRYIQSSIYEFFVIFHLLLVLAWEWKCRFNNWPLSSSSSSLSAVVVALHSARNNQYLRSTLYEMDAFLCVCVTDHLQ